MSFWWRFLHDSCFNHQNNLKLGMHIKSIIATPFQLHFYNNYRDLNGDHFKFGKFRIRYVSSINIATFWWWPGENHHKCFKLGIYIKPTPVIPYLLHVLHNCRDFLVVTWWKSSQSPQTRYLYKTNAGDSVSTTFPPWFDLGDIFVVRGASWWISGCSNYSLARPRPARWRAEYRRRPGQHHSWPTPPNCPSMSAH